MPLKVHDAVGACAAQSEAALAAFETPEENQRVKAEIRRRRRLNASPKNDNDNNNNNNWALGAIKLPKRAWMWLTREGMTTMTYGDWMDGRPDHGGGEEKERYLRLNGETGDLKWEDVGNVETNYICEYNPWKNDDGR